jgi:hypothetical protein
VNPPIYREKVAKLREFQGNELTARRLQILIADDDKPNGILLTGNFALVVENRIA